MKIAMKYFALVFLGLFAVGASQSWAQSAEPTDPSGNAGALKPRVETAGGYNPLNGNGTRSITDLHVPGAVGAYGLDFTRHWNSTDASFDPMQVEIQAPKAFAYGGWTHSWNWTASYSFTDSYCEAESQSCPGGVSHTVYHAITINYPDGRTGKFTFTAGGEDPLNAPFPPNLGGSMAVDDHLMGMDPAGNQFSLYLADGGSVHFESAGGRWRGDKVTDPHGFVTQLLYDTDGNLTTVSGPDGRSLRLTWSTLSGHPNKVISAVESGSGPGLQRVEYYYGLHTFDPTHKWQALTEARYVYPLDPSGQPIPSASYIYTPVLTTSSTAGWIQVGGPLLTYADDPRFEGAMNKIRYVFRGGPRGTALCTAPNNPTPAPPGNGGPYLVMAAFPVEQELSGETSLMVSKLVLPCNGVAATGTRTEYRGAGGSRTFFYGKAAGLEPNTVFHEISNGPDYWYPPEATPDAYTPYGYGSGFEPTKLADFADNPATPYDFAHPYGMHPWRTFDARGNLTQYIFQLPWSLDPSCNGRLKEIWYRGFDNTDNNGTNKVSVKTLNWDNAGASDAQNFTDVPNPYHHYLFSQTDERGLSTTYVRDSRRRIKRIDYPGGSSESFTYNNFNQVLTHTLASGAVVTYTYDASGFLTSESNSVEGSAARKDYTPDAFGRVATMQDGRARLAGAAYSVSMEYNARHQVVKVHYPWTGQLADPNVVYTYDGRGNCTAIKNELGYTSTFTYDAYRRCTSYTEPLAAPGWNGAGGGNATRTWNWIYDRALPPSYTAVVDASTHTSNKWCIQVEPGYNAAGDRKVTARNYDYSDRLIKEQTGGVLPAGQTVASGNWSFTGPDAETHSYEYDANGNKTKYTDPLNRVTAYVYDKRDRLIKTTEPLSRVTMFEYDRTGNKTKVTLPDSKTQQWLDLDGFGQPGRFIDERGNTTNMNYWPWGPMKQLAQVITHRDKDAGGTEDQLTSFYPTLLGRPEQVYFPDGSHEYFGYEAGQLKIFQTRSGVQKTISYDARGRETSHSWNDSITLGVTRVWDDANRLTSLSNSNSTIAYTYDQAGQVLTESNTVTGALGAAVLTSYRYGDGNPATLLYPNGFRLRRDYTARGQLSAIGSCDSSSGWLTRFAQYTYLSDGKVDLEDNPGNGMHTKFAYDGRGFVSQINTYRASSSQPYTKRDYYRDPYRDRMIAWKKGSYNSINPMENSRGDRYTYDNEGQLTAASYQATTPEGTPSTPQRTESFVYDQLGNRKDANTLAGRGTITFHRRDNGLNQYFDWSPNPVTYDDSFAPQSVGHNNGNLRQDGWLSSDYNALNQPLWFWSNGPVPSGYGLSFGFDPLGRRVKQWGGGQTTYLYYDGWNLIQEGPNYTTADRIYAHGNRVDETVASQYGGVWAYHHYDARGHCIMLTNASGNIIEQYDYDAFGKPYFYSSSNNFAAPVTSSGWGNRFLFTGREWLKDIAIYDFRNRHYLPELGRFMQPDPKQFEAGDYNLYRYCHNDPVNKSDWTGLSGELTIYSNGDGDSSSTSGHSWISYKQDGQSVTTTYGTWGNNPMGLGNGLHRNLEQGRQGEVTRTKHIDDKAEKSLTSEIDKYEAKGEKGWKMLAPCSTFARNAWRAGTGEKLKVGIPSTPSTLKKSIDAMNKADEKIKKAKNN